MDILGAHLPAGGGSGDAERYHPRLGRERGIFRTLGPGGRQIGWRGREGGVQVFVIARETPRVDFL